MIVLQPFVLNFFQLIIGHGDTDEADQSRTLPYDWIYIRRDVQFTTFGELNGAAMGVMPEVHPSEEYIQI